MEYQTILSANKPIVITIGNFDGIHKGHLRLLQRLHTQAAELDCKPVLVTFSPHTLEVVRPGIDIHYLTTLSEKLMLAKTYGGVAESIVILFTPQVAAMTAQEFMEDLCGRFPIKGLVVGNDFSLGHRRMGDITFLKQFGEEHGIAVEAITLEAAEERRISSTRIRTLVSEGHIEEANELLGHPFIATGTVKHGDKRGRQLGFPTANILPDLHKLLPAHGVYVVRAFLHEEQTSDTHQGMNVYNGVANIGTRPTFNGKERLLEVHLLDVNLDLYGKHLTVEFIAHLRSEQRFAGVDALKAQISQDVHTARQILAIGG